MIRLSAAALSALVLLASPVFAEDEAELQAYGEYLSGACVTCHQLSGVDDGIPSIVGWERPAFIAALKAYRSKQREHQVMRMITEPLSDEEIEALAAYFGAKKKPADTEEPLDPLDPLDGGDPF